MQEKSQIKKNILQFIDYKGITKYDFYKKTGITRGVLDQNNGMSEDNIARFLAYFTDVNVEWLITGYGEMLKDIYPSVVAETQGMYSTKGDKNIDFQRIPLYSLEAAAGIVQLFRDSKPTKDYIVIPNLPKCDGSMYISGDSMYPLLKSGDIVAYKQIKDIKNYSYIWGEMYIVNFQTDGDDYTTVKYVQPVENDDKRIKLISQNEHHKPITILKSDIRALALVKASVRINGMN